MSEPQIAAKMKEALLSLDANKTKAVVQQFLDSGVPAATIINDGLAPALTALGELFEKEEIFLPELIFGGKIGLEAVDRMKPYIEKQQMGGKKGLLLIGTVEGDVHEIGKNIVRLMATIGGYEVIDLGMDVKSHVFVEKVKELKPQFLGMSALLSTTLVHQKTVIELLKEAKLRDQVRVIVGGAPVHQAWAEKIGADGYGENAVMAVKELDRLRKMQY